MVQVETKTAVTEAGSEITFINSPVVAPTIYCDGFQGISVQPFVTKISLFEQISDPLNPGSILGRFVVNLSIPNDQFVNIVRILSGMVEDAVANQTIPPFVQADAMQKANAAKMAEAAKPAEAQE